MLSSFMYNFGAIAGAVLIQQMEPISSTLCDPHTVPMQPTADVGLGNRGGIQSIIYIVN